MRCVSRHTGNAERIGSNDRFRNAQDADGTNHLPPLSGATWRAGVVTVARNGGLRFFGHVEIAALKFVNNPGSSRLRKGATAGLSGNAKRKPPQSVLVV